MFTRHNTTGSSRTFFLPARVVFHHERHGMQSHIHENEDLNDYLKLRKGFGIPVDDEPDEKKGPKEKKESKERLKTHVSHAGFLQDPRKKDRWRYLKPRPKVEYLALKSEEARENFLKKHYGDIEHSIAAALRMYEGMPAFSKVPKITPSIETPELAVKTKVFALGNKVIQGVAEAFPGDSEYHGGSGTPASALTVFTSQIAKLPEDQRKGATVIIAFDTDIFASSNEQASHLSSTLKLLQSIKKAGMTAVVSTPFFIHEPADRKRRKEYTNFLAEQYQKGLIGSLIGLAYGLTNRGTNGVHEKYGSAEDLNAAGKKIAMNGFISGINVAHGHRSLDEEGLPLDRTSADAEKYYYGEGKKVEGLAKTDDLVPPIPSVADITDEDLKHSVWRIGILHVYLNNGSISYTKEQVEKEILIVLADVDAAEKNGYDVAFARLEVKRQMGEIYFMYAWKALQVAKEKPSAANLKAVHDALSDAQKIDSEHNFGYRFDIHLERVREVLEKISS